MGVDKAQERYRSILAHGGKDGKLWVARQDSEGSLRLGDLEIGECDIVGLIEGSCTK